MKTYLNRKRLTMGCAVLALAFGLASCAEDDSGTRLSKVGETCSKTGDCESGLVCMGAVCQIEGANCPADKDCGDEVLIPAGTFWMGCNEAVDTQCYSDEKPYHEVYLDAYYIDRTEVTAAAYEVCVTAGGCTAPGSGSYSTYQKPGMEDHPINRVTWFQAEAYCAWAGKRLPTEAEWEKAARGTDGRKYPWGNATATCDLAVMSACPGDTQPVCSVSPAGDSPYGLCDMAGNVWEWVADWYSSSYYSSSPGSNPAGPASGSSRVVRGGRFGNDDVTLSVSIRYDDNPSAYYYFLGFRCGRDAP